MTNYEWRITIRVESLELRDKFANAHNDEWRIKNDELQLEWRVEITITVNLDSHFL